MSQGLITKREPTHKLVIEVPLYFAVPEGSRSVEVALQKAFSALLDASLAQVQSQYGDRLCDTPNVTLEEVEKSDGDRTG